jgi:hypothetical protein
VNASRRPAVSLALGLDLQVVATSQGGRAGPIDGAEAFSYRPNWQLPGMTGTEQVGAPVACFSQAGVSPGDRVRAVITPLYLETLPLWRALVPGDELRMFEGHRICGIASLLWTSETKWPLPDAQLHALRERLRPHE